MSGNTPIISAFFHGGHAYVLKNDLPETKNQTQQERDSFLSCLYNLLLSTSQLDNLDNPVIQHYFTVKAISSEAMQVIQVLQEKSLTTTELCKEIMFMDKVKAVWDMTPEEVNKANTYLSRYINPVDIKTFKVEALSDDLGKCHFVRSNPKTYPLWIDVVNKYNWFKNKDQDTTTPEFFMNNPTTIWKTAAFTPVDANKFVIYVHPEKVVMTYDNPDYKEKIELNHPYDAGDNPDPDEEVYNNDYVDEPSIEEIASNVLVTERDINTTPFNLNDWKKFGFINQREQKQRMIKAFTENQSDVALTSLLLFMMHLRSKAGGFDTMVEQVKSDIEDLGDAKSRYLALFEKLISVQKDYLLRHMTPQGLDISNIYVRNKVVIGTGGKMQTHNPVSSFLYFGESNITSKKNG
jgi:hypothetical protein